MKFNALKIFTVSIFALGASSEAQAICLDYWIKGPAACKDQEDQKQKILIQGGKNIDINFEKDEARIAYEKDLDIKVDKFIEAYGKPPREFVAFHLDPTLENAIRWVKKFETEYDRTRKIAVAWRQADNLFKEYKKTGSLSLPPESGVSEAQVKYLLTALEENPTDLKEVKGFGNKIDDSDWADNILDTNYAKLDYKDDSYTRAVNKIAKTGNNSDYSLKALERKSKEPRYEKPSKPTKKVKETVNTTNKLEISYYFSAKCPFCEQFKPQLKSAIEDFGKDKVSLTCVDMTPGDKKPENIKGKLDCKWRPLLAGEASQFGVKSTPSLLVKRSGSSDLELIENYYDADVLLNYFKNGAN